MSPHCDFFTIFKGECPIRGVFGLLKAFWLFSDSEYIYFIEVWIKIGLFMLKTDFLEKSQILVKKMLFWSFFMN